MAIGIGIGMGISGPSQHTVTGWFEVDAACAFTLPSLPFTSLLTNVEYKEGDYVQTKVSGIYVGKRILLGKFFTVKPEPATYIEVEPGSLVYNACQV